jgi:hypothetical protein
MAIRGGVVMAIRSGDLMITFRGRDLIGLGLLDQRENFVALDKGCKKAGNQPGRNGNREDPRNHLNPALMAGKGKGMAGVMGGIVEHIRLRKPDTPEKKDGQ